MASQLDLDQGGISRQLIRKYLGPSVGWITVLDNSILPVVTGGTTTVLIGTSLVLVNVASAVTIQLPSALESAAGAQAVPYSFVGKPITVIDLGGHADSFSITILPFGSEKIIGLSSIAIVAKYGAYTLNPNLETGGYTLTQS